MAQFVPAPVAAPLQPGPSDPHGPYRFGMPDVLIRIKFPSLNQALPWYWWFPKQTPFYFSYLAPQGKWGPGWVDKQIYGVIKILPIDTQPEVPVVPVGETSLEASIDNGIPNGNFGRFKFTEDFFWKLIGTPKPKFDVIQGIPTTRKDNGGDNIGKTIKTAVKLWETDWNLTGKTFNLAAQAVTPNNGEYSGVQTSFKVPLPPPNTTLPDLANMLDKIYFGPIPVTYIFETGQALVTKQGYAFTINVSQLDPTKWDMSVFPPRRAIPDIVGPGDSSALSQNYGGYSTASPSFPIIGPNLV